ncbi:flagellar hook-associated protein FlgK [Desulfocurvibacter africanus PCS]|uniref:Flagellar hook-associated protein 1 n=1 Tax=Desulfocurvibacter africanus PCS TaxID=1262666 RepID=M5PQP9_DESAF|nr:flagellar hook-associated protein FlgK [Desulfocurvibacter africanus]EMG36360.1 flagellar hook-associated protein FlgK [Desulfocurvibacter africanus PCS]
MISNLFSIGANALLNYQTAINVNGNNVANAEAAGYSRRTVDFATRTTTDKYYGQVGTGSIIEAIRRNYNTYIEDQYLGQSADTNYWSTVTSNCTAIESLFVQVEDDSLASVLDSLWTGFEGVSSDPGGTASRTELLGMAETLTGMLNDLYADMRSEEERMNAEIRDQVNEVNDLLGQIAEVNKSLVAHPENTGLQDKRSTLLTDLAEYVDIRTIEQADGQITVQTLEGQTLVDGSKAYSFTVQGPQATASLTPTSGFDGAIYFEGTSSNELQIEFLTSGDTSGGAGAATFKVSMDGGKTWLSNDDGSVQTFAAGDIDHQVEIDGVSIWFGNAADSSIPATTNIEVGDRFNVVPKTGVYWVKTTSNMVNVTPLEGASNRLSGGSLAGLTTSRDKYLGEAQERMDALAASLIWEVNYAHSQGAGLSHHQSLLGTYEAEYTDRALSESGLSFADRLTGGSLSFALYDEDTGEALGVTSVDFSGVVATDGNTYSTFDPSVHSLENVQEAINDTFPGQLTASITDGRLMLAAEDGYEFESAGDSTGLLAGLGLNTFFAGDDMESIAVNPDLLADAGRVNSGHVNGAGEINEGDNTTSTALAALRDTEITLSTTDWSMQGSLSECLATLVSKVGGDTATAKTSFEVSFALAQDLYERQQSVAGVNLDEELVNLAKLQDAFEAASKLITTANEMFDVVLSLKD